MHNTRFKGSISIVGLAISFVLVFIGLVWTIYKSTSGGSSNYASSKIALYCMAEKKGFEVTRQEYQDMLNKAREAVGQKPGQGPMGPAGMMEMMIPWGQYPNYPMVCPKCGKKACFNAVKCKKCGNIFIPYNKEGKYDDTCPKCHYSRVADIRKKRAAERAAKRQRQRK